MAFPVARGEECLAAGLDRGNYLIGAPVEKSYQALIDHRLAQDLNAGQLADSSHERTGMSAATLDQRSDACAAKLA